MKAQGNYPLLKQKNMLSHNIISCEAVFAFVIPLQFEHLLNLMHFLIALSSHTFLILEMILLFCISSL